MIKREMPALAILTESSKEDADWGYLDKKLLKAEPGARQIPEKRRKAAFAHVASKVNKALDKAAWDSKVYALYSDEIDQLMSDDQ